MELGQMLFGTVLSCVVTLLFALALRERRIGILATTRDRRPRRIAALALASAAAALVVDVYFY